jgi:ComF family protein
MNIVDIFFPRKCFGCGLSGYYLCPECVRKTRPPKLACPKCNGLSPDGAAHIRCKDIVGLDGRVSLWKHSGGMRKAIAGMKYKFAFEIAKELAKHAAKKISKEKLFFPKNSVLVPIPLYWHRKNWRGFNQSEEIGQMIAEKIGWGFDKNLLIRKASKKPQASLKKEKRMANIKGVFSLIKPPDKNVPVILFDDVWTTGSTAKEAASILKEEGVKRVNCLTLTS